MELFWWFTGTIAHQIPLSMGFSSQEYKSGISFTSLGDFPDLGIEPESPALQVDSLPSEPCERVSTRQQKNQDQNARILTSPPNALSTQLHLLFR